MAVEIFQVLPNGEEYFRPTQQMDRRDHCQALPGKISKAGLFAELFNVQFSQLAERKIGVRQSLCHQLTLPGLLITGCQRVQRFMPTTQNLRIRLPQELELSLPSIEVTESDESSVERSCRYCSHFDHGANGFIRGDGQNGDPSDVCLRKLNSLLYASSASSCRCRNRCQRLSIQACR